MKRLGMGLVTSPVDGLTSYLELWKDFVMSRYLESRYLILCSTWLVRKLTQLA